MAIEQKMFLNYDDSNTISVSITVYETVVEYEMLTEGDVEDEVATHSLGQGSSVTWDLRIPPGAIRGFGVYNGVSFTNPDPTNLTVLTTTGKDPWPPPPPPPPLFAEVEDFEDRYEAFLMGLSGKRTSRADRAAAAAPPAAPPGEVG
jgi:hypothetical protein